MNMNNCDCKTKPAVRVVSGNDLTMEALVSIYDRDEGVYKPLDLSKVSDVTLRLVGTFGKVPGKGAAVSGSKVSALFPADSLKVGVYGVEITFRDANGRGRAFERGLIGVVATSGEATVESSAEGETGEGLNITVDVKTRTVSIGGSGVADYSLLENKPSINDVTLEGNKTLEELGFAKVAASGSYKDLSDTPSKLSQFIDDTYAAPFKIDLYGLPVSTDKNGDKVYDLSSFGKSWGATLQNGLRMGQTIWINYSARGMGDDYPRWAMICSYLFNRYDECFFGFTNDGKWYRFSFVGLLTTPFSASLTISELGTVISFPDGGDGTKYLNDMGGYTDPVAGVKSALEPYDCTELWQIGKGDDCTEAAQNLFKAIKANRPLFTKSTLYQGGTDTTHIEVIAAVGIVDEPQSCYVSLHSFPDIQRYECIAISIDEEAYDGENAHYSIFERMSVNIQEELTLKTVNGQSLVGDGNVETRVVEPIPAVSGQDTTAGVHRFPYFTALKASLKAGHTYGGVVRFIDSGFDPNGATLALRIEAVENGGVVNLVVTATQLDGAGDYAIVYKLLFTGSVDDEWTRLADTNMLRAYAKTTDVKAMINAAVVSAINTEV